MKKVYYSIFILSFIHFIFIGFGGLHAATESGINESKIISSSFLSFNNDQIYRVGTKEHQVSEFSVAEITEDEEDNKLSKLLLNPFLTSILVKEQFNNTKADFPKSLIPANIDRYLLLQTLRL